MELAQLDTSHPFSATLLAARRLTPASSAEEVKELLLETSGLREALSVGQSIGVMAPGGAEFGKSHHLRLYSVADLPETSDPGRARFRIAVRRCSYIDEYSGERYEGVASNYLCDLELGARIQLTGPYGAAFNKPPENDATLILVATSTGIAPFRAFVRHLYEQTEFYGPVWLFYGAKSGLDMAYLNDEQDDFAQYYDRETFEAFRVLSPRPHFGDAIDWGATLAERGHELWRRLSLPSTYVYLAGLRSASEALDRALEGVAGSKDKWRRRKAELQAGERWVELLY